jgi:hypothetical protein
VFHKSVPVTSGASGEIGNRACGSALLPRRGKRELSLSRLALFLGAFLLLVPGSSPQGRVNGAALAPADETANERANSLDETGDIGPWTIRKRVDEAMIFFTVSDGPEVRGRSRSE